ERSDVCQVSDQERGQAREEQVRRQHEEDVAKKRERERREQPRRGMAAARIDEQREERGRFGDVLEGTYAPGHGKPVEEREDAEGHERHGLHTYIWRRTARDGVPVARAIAAV